MHSTPLEWEFIFNPAAIMHSQWKFYLPHWGIPEKLCPALWKNRHAKGTLSRFLVARFKFGTRNLLEEKITKQKILFLKNTQFENKLIQLGSLFFHHQIIKIIDGGKIREIRKDFGDKNFNFLQQQAASFISPPLAAFISASKIEGLNRSNAILVGLALLLKNLPPNPDLLPRLCLKLPPLAKTPNVPDGFILLQNTLKLGSSGTNASASAAAIQKFINYEGQL